MRILYYSAHPHLNLASPSGYGTHMREMIGAFRELGHEVRPLIMGGTEMMDQSSAIPRVSGFKAFIKSIIPSYIWESLKDFRLLQFDQTAKQQLKKAIAEFRPDLIYERANFLQLSGVETAKEMGIPHVLEVNAPYVEERKRNWGNSLYVAKAGAYEAKQLQLTGTVVVVSSPLREYYVKKHGIPAAKFLVTPNAVNPSEVKVVDEVVSRIHSQYKLKGAWVAGFVGSIQPWHGVDVLIRGFAHFHRDRSDARLLIVGDGLIIDELKALAKSLGVGEAVIFTGNVPFKEVFSYLSLMDVTVLARTAWYCSPVKIFEYGAMGKPVLAMDTPSVSEVMVHGEHGWLVEDRPEALAEGLQRLAAEPELAERLSANFKEKVFSRHLWQNNAREVLKRAGK